MSRIRTWEILLLLGATVGCAHSGGPAHPARSSVTANAGEVRVPVCPMNVAAPLVQMEETSDGAALLFAAKDESTVDELRRQVELMARLHNRANAHPVAPPLAATTTPTSPVAFDWLSGLNTNPLGFGGSGTAVPMPAPLPAPPSLPVSEGLPSSALTPLPPSTATVEPLAPTSSTPAGVRLSLHALDSADRSRLANGLDERALALGSGYCLLIPLDERP